ncbi:MAG: DUF4065 domain-containing protein [Bacteroidales bacterium]|nr:DUF4065 domain-containing protein [Bacteroidales bacterium]
MDEERTGRHELHAKVNSDISEIKTAIQYIKGSLEMIQQGLRNNNPYTRANSPTGITRDGHGLVERAGMDQMIDENRTRIKSTVLAKYIAACLNGNGADVNMTKVQKLTYIAYGTCLAVTGNRLADEHPQAWPYGPVFPAARSKLLKTDLNCIRLSDPDLQEISNDATVKSLVMLVCKSFGKWPAFALSEWSYKDGSPWERTVSSRGFKWGKEINDEYIRSYFRKIVVISDE